jgi:hypothetical protein
MDKFMVTAYMLDSIVFAAVSAILYMICVPRVTFASVMRYLAALGTIFMVLAYWFGVSGIPVSIGSFTVVVLLLTAPAGYLRFVKKKKIDVFSHERDDKNGGFISKILPLLAVFSGLVVGYVYFGGDFSFPQYVSPDPAVHFLLGKKVYLDESIQYFSRSIFFPDSFNIHTYPYGAAVITGIFMGMTRFWNVFTSYQVFNVVIFALVNGYGFFVLQKIFKVRNLAIAAILLLMMTLGFYLNHVILGFTSQLAGMFFLFLCLDVIVTYEWSLKKAVLLAVGLSATTITYFYWVPFVLLVLIVKDLKLLDIRDFRKNRKMFAFMLLTAGVFLILTGHYFYMVLSSTILEVIVGAEGLAYGVFLVNIILFIPFLCVFLYGHGWRKPRKWGYDIILLVTALFITGSLGVLFKLGVLRTYTFVKGFSLTIPVIYWASMKGLEEVSTRLGKSKNVFMFSFLTVIAWIIIIPFLFPNPGYKLHEALPIRIDDLDARVLDVYYYNGQSFVNPNIHAMSLDTGIKEFAEQLSEELPEEYRRDKISVVADGNRCLWFYTFSDIWPRDIEGQLFLWVPEMIDYDSWLNGRGSDVLILLDTGMTDEWIKESGFDWDDFEVLYQQSGNFILEYVGEK